MQQNIEHDRNNPPLASMPAGPHHYMRGGTVQYFPGSNDARSEMHGHHTSSFHHNNNSKLAPPHDYRRPSSAPLTPVEPKKIGMYREIRSFSFN